MRRRARRTAPEPATLTRRERFIVRAAVVLVILISFALVVYLAGHP